LAIEEDMVIGRRDNDRNWKQISIWNRHS
jgi:hypothetical protein